MQMRSIAIRLKIRVYKIRKTKKTWPECSVTSNFEESVVFDRFVGNIRDCIWLLIDKWAKFFV